MNFAQEKEQIFMDKRIISFAILEKEMKMIETYNDLIQNIRFGYVKKQNLNQAPDFISCWRNAKELFDALEFNKIQTMADLDDDRLEVCRNNIKKYNNLEDVNINDLTKTYNILREIISKAGYHDDSQKSVSSPRFASDELE